jgi:hypothetical protein
VVDPVDGISANDDAPANIRQSPQLSFKLIFCVCYTFSVFGLWSLACLS